MLYLLLAPYTLIVYKLLLRSIIFSLYYTLVYILDIATLKRFSVTILFIVRALSYKLVLILLNKLSIKIAKLIIVRSSPLIITLIGQLLM